MAVGSNLQISFLEQRLLDENASSFGMFWYLVMYFNLGNVQPWQFFNLRLFWSLFWLFLVTLSFPSLPMWSLYKIQLLMMYTYFQKHRWMVGSAFCENLCWRIFYFFSYTISKATENQFLAQVLAGSTSVVDIYCLYLKRWEQFCFWCTSCSAF